MINTQDSVDVLMEIWKRDNRSDRIKKKGQYTLGRLISELESLKQVDVDCNVYLDFGPSPLGLDSWRGSYEELAINWDDSYKKIRTYSEFLSMLKSIVGCTLMGYKGGDYVMDNDTPLWVAQYGQATTCAICGITYQSYEDSVWNIVLNTEYLIYS